uniref:EF-hand domain-containing protein n=1 Tax=Chenopodium quinoa TaxID=63459 RepID=A0A803KTF9_CHEQI
MDAVELMRVFQMFDHNGDGMITMGELRESLTNMGIIIPDSDLTQLIGRIDVNGDGCVDGNEFQALYTLLMEREVDAQSDEEDMKEAFNVFDKNGDGFISVDELRSVLGSLGLNQGRNLEDCKLMIMKVDVDGDGMVSFKEFKKMMKQEIAVSRGKLLDLLRVDDNGKLLTLLSVEIFGIIRSLTQFRLTGSQKDYIVVGSDSGRIVILEYNKISNSFDKSHQETFGKSGCRRVVPGQFSGVDPKGRAVMVGACEKQKFVYVLNRDSSARLTISSPIEAHKSHVITLCYFWGQAAAEAQKHLAFCELDVGLNHVSRKWSEPIDNGANMLIAVPGGRDGPSGMLVCAENFVIYKNQGHPDVRCLIPRRLDLPAERGVLIVSAVKHKSMPFFLLQSEYGDVFKVTLECGDEGVSELKLKYFDTIPVTCSMCVVKPGYLFAASEFGDHALYQFMDIGDEPDVESSSARMIELETEEVTNFFEEETPQIYALCGQGPRSSLRILRPGLEITEMATSSLPGVPNGVWTVKKNANDEFDAYVVVPFATATLVLSIGETVEEVIDSGFLDTTPSLAVVLMGDDSLIQFYPSGIRNIREDGRINKWSTQERIQLLRSGTTVIKLSLH